MLKHFVRLFTLAASGLAVSLAGAPSGATAIPQARAVPEVDSVILRLQTSLGVGGFVTTKYEPYVLYDDGRISRVPDVALADLDFGAASRRRPGAWGRWQRRGAAYAITWDNGKTSLFDGRMQRARPGKLNLELTGRYRSISGGGNVAFGGSVTVIAIKEYSFYLDGTFEASKTSGGFSDDIATRQRSSNRGRYRIDGWTISLTYPDGHTERRFFFQYPDSDAVIGIGASTFSKRS